MSATGTTGPGSDDSSATARDRTSATSPARVTDSGATAPPGACAPARERAPEDLAALAVERLPTLVSLTEKAPRPKFAANSVDVGACHRSSVMGAFGSPVPTFSHWRPRPVET